jgi:hypothetical protein
MRPRNSTNISLSRVFIGAGALLTLWLCAGCAAMHSTPFLAFLTVTPNSPAIALGQSLQFKVVATYSDETTEDVTGSVDWQTLDPGVATVNESGLAGSVAVGRTTIVATKSGARGEAALVVSKAALTGISVASPPSPIALGQSAQLVATGTYTDKSTQDITSSVSWSAAQPSVVEVSATGLAVSKVVGSTEVTASLSNISASGQITVSAAMLASVAVGASHPSLPLGGTEQLSAIGTYTDGNTKDFTASATWTSSSPGVLAVSSTGAVTTKSVGAAVVSAAVSGFTSSANLIVSSASLVSIAVSAGHPSLPLGNTEQVSATGTYTDGSTKDLSASAAWSSSSPGVLAVSSTGAVTTKSVGAAVVSAAVSGITGSANLTVSSASLVSIAVSAGHPSLPLGNTEQLSATGTYTDGSTKDLTASATWTSSSPVLAVSSTGTVTTKSVGAAVVSAAVSSITGKASLTVSAAALSGISISAASATVPLGDTLQLNAMGHFTDGSTQDVTGSVNWSSSSRGVLTVAASGLATAIAVGTVSVAASSSTITGVVSLAVSGPVLSTLSLAPAGPTLPLGSTLQLTVTGAYSDGSTQDVTSQVSWNIDIATIASITAGGLVSGLQVGSTAIEASLNGVQTSDILTVQPLFTVGYYDATSGIDSTIRITNPATTSQSLCAMVYVFDQDQQMSECCGCMVSQDGLRTFSLNKDLLSNPLTGVPSKSGTVMLVAADQSTNTSCNASAITPAGTVIGWSTHISQSGALSSEEEPFSNSPLSATLSAAIQAQCAFVQQLGSGQGLCGCGNTH